MSEIMFYPASGSLQDLCSTFGGDEDGFRARLEKLERATNAEGENATKATYEEIPPSQPYEKKKLFCFNLAGPVTQPPNTETAIESADVYINDQEAQIVVYREK